MAKKMKKDTQLLLLIASILVVMLLIRNGGIFAFEDPLNNNEPNPSVEDWVPGNANDSGVYKLPIGWSFSGWSHGPNWEDLTPVTSVVRTGTFSAGFIDKGFNGQLNVAPCDDWCRFETGKASVTAQTIVKARYYIYPEYFTRYSSDDGVRVTLNFYDASGQLLGNGGGTTLKEADFSPSMVWKEKIIEAVSPPGTASAAIQFTLATRQENQFMTTFYIDDIWIESSACTEDWVCDAWSYCRAGYQIRECTDNNACGLTFNKPDVNRICDGTIEQYKEEFKKGNMGLPGLMEEIKTWRDGYLTSSELEQMWWVARYGERENGWIYSWHRSEAYLGWEDAMAISSMLTMYEATGKTEYLDLAVQHLDYEVSLWPFTGGNWDNGAKPADDRASGGNLVENYVRFAYITKRDGLTQYASKAQEYSQFAEDNFLQYWKAETQVFTKNGVDMGCVAEGVINTPGQPWHCDRFNAMLTVHTAFLYQYLYNGDTEYRNLAIRGANLFKYLGLHIVQNTDGSFGEHYEWGYRVYTGEPDDEFAYVPFWGAYESGHAEEVHYGAYDLKAAYTFWKHGLVFTNTDMKRFANTISHAMWNGDMAEPLLNKQMSNWSEPIYGDMHGAFETGYIHGMTNFNEFDPLVKEITERITKKLYDDSVANNNFWSEYYQCINSADFGKICYMDVRTQPEMQMESIANILYQRKQLGE